MKGFIYIAGAFQTVNRSKCGQGGAWIDNDPHFWTDPPTWGICRNDLRKKAVVGDYVFFVLPRGGRHPQMIFGYIQIADKTTHIQAYHRPDLTSKRMGNKNPNGNILTDAIGRYNRFDKGFHERQFDRIKNEYAIGSCTTAKFLDDRQIRRLAPTFIGTLSGIIGIPMCRNQRAIDVITRQGRQLNSRQVKRLIIWLE